MVERKATRFAPLIGAAAGGLMNLIWVTRDGDLTGTGNALWAGLGAGIGALAGLVVRETAPYRLVYDAGRIAPLMAPKPTRGNDALRLP